MRRPGPVLGKGKRQGRQLSDSEVLLVRRSKGHPGSLHVGGRDAAAAAGTDHCGKPALDAALQMRKCVDTRTTYSPAGLRQTKGGNAVVSILFTFDFCLQCCYQYI